MCGIEDVRDELDYTNKKIIRRFDKTIFDGSDDEEWTLSATLTNYVRFSKAVNANHLTPQMFSHFKYINNYTLDEEHAYIYNNILYVFVSKAVASTLEEFKSYLSQNNLEIVYRLSNEIVEDIDCSDKIVQFDEQTTVYNTDGAEIEVSLTNNKAIAQINQNLQRIEELLAKIGGE